MLWLTWSQRRTTLSQCSSWCMRRRTQTSLTLVTHKLRSPARSNRRAVADLVFPKRIGKPMRKYKEWSFAMSGSSSKIKKRKHPASNSANKTKHPSLNLTISQALTHRIAKVRKPIRRKKARKIILWRRAVKTRLLPKLEQKLKQAASKTTNNKSLTRRQKDRLSPLSAYRSQVSPHSLSYLQRRQRHPD